MSIREEMAQIRIQLEESTRMLSALRQAVEEKTAQLDGTLYEIRQRTEMLDSLRRESPNRSYWRVRYWADVMTGKGLVERKRRSQFLGYCPTTNDPAERKKRVEITKREADRLRSDLMERVNAPTQVVQSQIPLADFVGIWMERHVGQQGVAVNKKYRSFLKSHFLPVFGESRLCDLDAEVLQDWVNRKRVSWWTKKGLLGMVSSIYKKASDWGYWHERNPAERVSPGKKRHARPRRLLSLEDTDRLVAELPAFLQLIVALLRTTGSRISEALGLEWRHLDLVDGWVAIEQRWYRGNLDVVKTERSRRDVPLGLLSDRFRELREAGGAAVGEGSYVFDRGDGQPWDDRKLLRDFVRPKARELGCYFEGLGFHSFRREVATRIQEAGASSVEAQLLLGHASIEMTSHYTLPQRERMKKLVENMQERGSAAGGVVEFREEKQA